MSLPTRTKTTTADGEPLYVTTYDSVYDVIDEVLNVPADRRGEAWIEDRDRTSFYGTPSFDHAQTLARDGWNEPRPIVESIADQVMSNDMIRRVVDNSQFRPVWDVAGSVPDVGRYVTGDPENMIEFQLTAGAKSTRVARIVVNGSIVCNVHAEAIQRRGAMVCALIEVLGRCGWSCEVVADFSNDNIDRTKHSSIIVKIHDPAEPLDIDSIMFQLAHPSMCRRLIFGAMEAEPANVREFLKARMNGAYGYPAKDPLSGDALGADIVIRKVEPADSELDPADWVLERVMALTGLTVDA